MRMITRLIGSLFLALMLIMIVMDGAKVLSSNELVFTPLGQIWFEIDRALDTLTLNTLQAIIQRYVHPIVWDPIIVTILGAPAWLICAILGVFFLFLGRTRTRERYKHIDEL
ncbi:hypothetical protein [Maritalea porphyrae]|jgi:hypothetical protein|uniref:hypothetical protein n=1 Tax=Maritalea porphyrae TaxID=880732 RepID=UPI0022AEEA2B|nr:hypothetical protein [Maritalea porphyrae]MCZ4271860.1 hypothetical protein [Maritalea porphyrae]